VIFIAAFRGLNLLRLGFADFVCSVLDCSTGLDFCASLSGTLILAASFDLFCSELLLGETVSFNRGSGPAIEVSGMLVFRGGIGKSVGRLCG